MPFLLSRWFRRVGAASVLLLSGASYAAAKVRSTIHALSDIPFNADNRLSQHLLLYPAGACAALLEPQLHWDPHNRLVHSVAGEARALFFPDAGDGGCSAVCVRRGTARELVHALMPHHRYDPERQPDFFRDFFSPYCEQVESGFMNYHTAREGHLDFYWISHGGERVYQGELKYGERNTRFISSYLGHTFELVDPASGELVRRHTVDYDHIIAAGLPPSIVEEHPRSRADQIRSTHENEWFRHKKVQRTFSPLGFTKGRLPDDLFASMGAYYYNNAPEAIFEEWTGKGVFVNWWEAPVRFVQIPWALKTVWQDRLRLLVERWTGTPLENTDLYGMRRYEDGARLLTHVDRESTHAASLIVNVAQGNLDRPWTVEVHDHADRLHEVVMAPGDLVYYESAACLHARNTPLRGGSYVNLFAHYRPVGDPDWYQRENPPGTPERLLDVGRCRLVGEADAMSQGAVVCEDPRIGPHLSPTMFTATNGADLYEWWEASAEGPPKRMVGEVAQNAALREEEETCQDCNKGPVGENSSSVHAPPQVTPFNYDEL